MSASDARLNAITAVINFKKDSSLSYENPLETFGARVFDDKQMQACLPKQVYKSLRHSIVHMETLDPEIADIVANAMKEWAVERGATHYTHIFYPHTGLTAEKHDSFLTVTNDGSAIAELSGTNLIKGEADGSSLPTGGLRSTFEARGYTAWDITSPAYLLEHEGGRVLCIPTAFLSWTGFALDKKTPLLRSLQSLNKEVKRLLNIFEVDTKLPITSNAGLEQEYFLIDRNFYFARQDLVNTGRTLFGAKPPRGQEDENQYYGVIPRRVLSFMSDVEQELYKYGIPITTRHNEAAPSQYELAPTYEAANIALDHNQLIMTTLKGMAKRHGMYCLLHEKPFAGINGSGKHLNYSIGNAEVGNLFDQGETPHENAQFLVFLCCAIRGIHKFGPYLRATVATASNDHRLGASEAPPAIMSIFLGDQLTDILEQFRAGKENTSRKKRMMNLGVDSLPTLAADSGDRNRTSPFAFIGNRFEFRAPGASQSASEAQVGLNLMFTEALDFASSFLEEEMKKNKKDLWAAVQAFIEHIMEEHAAVIFNGDGYSDIWHKEAERRGLKNLKTTPEALTEYKNSEVVEAFNKYHILSKQEIKSRHEIALEHYNQVIKREANTMIRMARTIIYPAAIRYQTELAQNIIALQAVKIKQENPTLDAITENLAQFEKALIELEKQVNHKESNSQKASVYSSTVLIPTMATLRKHADILETLVADSLWQLPTYQEMLFVK